MKQSGLEEEENLKFLQSLVINSSGITAAQRSTTRSNRNCKHTIRLPSVELEKSMLQKLEKKLPVKSSSACRIRERRKVSLTPHNIEMSFQEEMKNKFFRNHIVKRHNSKNTLKINEKIAIELLENSLAPGISNLILPLPNIEHKASENQRKKLRIRSIRRLPTRYGKENLNNQNFN